VESHAQLAQVIDDIVASRHVGSVDTVAVTVDTPGMAEDSTEAEDGTEGGEEPGAQTAEDIWLNELEYTGYLRQLRPRDGSGLPKHLLVRNLPRWREACQLRAAIPLQPLSPDLKAIEGYFDRLSAAPSDQVREILCLMPDVATFVVPDQATYDATGSALTGAHDTVGALSAGSLVVLTGENLSARVAGTMFRVEKSVDTPAHSSVTVHLHAVAKRPDGQPLVLPGEQP